MEDREPSVTLDPSVPEGTSMVNSKQIIGPFIYNKGTIKPLFTVVQLDTSINSENFESGSTQPSLKSTKQTRLNFPVVSRSSGTSDESSSSTAATMVANSVPLISHMRPSGKREKSDVWEFFTYDKASNKSTCKVDNCTTELVGNFSTNLKKHLRAHHPTTFQTLEKKSTRKKMKRQQQQPSICFDTKYSLSNEKQKRFVCKLTWWVATNPVANSVIANDEFINVIRVADPKLTVPSRPIMEKSADDLYQKAKSVVMEELNSMRRYTLLSDIWTKKGYSSSYLGVTATGYSPEQKKKINIVLSVKEFESVTHTAADVLREMSHTSEKFNLDIQKVWRTMTDGGSEMVCSHRDACTFLNNLINEEKISAATPEETQNPAEQSFLNQSVGISEDGSEIEVEVLGVSEYRRLPCFIHSLLCCLDSIENDEVISGLSKRLRQAVSTVTQSSKLTQTLVQKTGVKLTLFNNTRKWNVTYLVASRLLRVRAEFSKMMDEFDKKNSDLSDDDWHMVIILNEFLEPFFDATNMSERESDLVSSYVVVTLKTLYTHLESYINSDFLSSAVKAIKTKMDDKFLHWLQYPTDSRKNFEGSFLAATLFDPRYRCILNDSEKERTKWFLIDQHCPFDLENNNNSITSSILPEENLSTDLMGKKVREKKSTQFVKKYKQQLKSNKVNENLGAIVNPLAVEIEKYLVDDNFDFSDDENDGEQQQQEVLDFWEGHKKNYKLLTPLALDYLSLPSSIAFVEGTFSRGGIVTGGRRCRLEGNSRRVGHEL